MKTKKNNALNQPVILERKTIFSSPWITLVESKVQFTREKPVQDYYALAGSDYVTIVAMTPSGKVPIVRQFRPAVGLFTYELPAGTIDPGETAEFACTRELKEETGLKSLSVKSMGIHYPDTGRVSNRMHTFFVLTSEADPHFEDEEGLEVSFVSLSELKTMIRDGSFSHQLHVGAFLFCEFMGAFNAK